VQEAWVWALERPQKLNALLDEDDEQERTRKLRNALCNHLDRVARKEKAAILGYEPEDEYFYSLGQLRELLPQVYGEKADWVSFSASDNEVKPTSDPAEGGNRVASLVDVGEALGRLSQQDQWCLYLRYGTGASELDIAENHLQVEQGAAHMRIERALKRLRQELGGSPPRYDAPEYIGSRRVMTAPHAQAITGG